jgi:exodeoxyribonuclease VII small subunit
MKNEERSVEENLKELEALIKKLEAGELPLDDSIEKFSTCVDLYKKCKSHLVQAEKKIKILTDSLKEEDL